MDGKNKERDAGIAEETLLKQDHQTRVKSQLKAIKEGVLNSCMKHHIGGQLRFFLVEKEGQQPEKKLS